MPPIWEYASGGYRDAGALGYDMGLLTRYVAIDLLFAPSPSSTIRSLPHRGCSAARSPM